jgi:mannan endo-1,4-beta-mannosidase
MEGKRFLPWTFLFFTLVLMSETDAQTNPASQPAAQPVPHWVNPQPEIPYRPKPATRAADWIVEHDPVNPDATPEARALLKFLYSISGTHTLSGQHNYAGDQEYSTDLTARLAHKTPVIYGTDWGFAKLGDKDSAYVRQKTVEELIKQYRNGSIIALCWHEVRPTQEEPVTFRHDILGRITDAQFDQIISPGTALYQRWCEQVDVIAGFLKQLQDARVPVLFRPYHEMNGDWFWWGGRRGERGTMQVYRQIFHRFVDYHHLNNLIWVWNCDQPAREDRQFVDYFPGQQYVDVLALDDYAAFHQRYYDEMNALSDGKVMAIAETFSPPPIETYSTQPKWAYWMRWALDRPHPTTRPHPLTVELADLMTDSRMWSLEDRAYRKAIEPVRAESRLPPLP